MPHWSQNAQQAASTSMGTTAPDSTVTECPDNDWEPVIEIQEPPEWEMNIVIVETAEQENGNGEAQ